MLAPEINKVLYLKCSGIVYNISLSFIIIIITGKMVREHKGKK